MDSIKTNQPKKKPKKIDEMSKEQIRQAIIKKRECNTRAQTIVESLLEKCINEEYFLQCLPEINQAHLEDVIEERSILHLCGFPLCQNAISERDIPKQKYRISIKTNKVYDITLRKSFCSNSCYVSAMHVKKQMLTSPLWFREYEEIPVFHLLPFNTKGSLGQEVDLGIPEMISSKPNKSEFASVNDLTKSNLSAINSDPTEQGTEYCRDAPIHIPPRTNMSTDTKELEVSSLTNNSKFSSKSNESELPLKSNESELSLKSNESELSLKSTESELSLKSNESELSLKSNESELPCKSNESELPCKSNESEQSLKSLELPSKFDENEHPLKTNFSTSEYNNKVELSKTQNKKSPSNPLNIIGEIIEKPVKTIDPILLAAPIEENKMKKTQKVKKTRQKKQHLFNAITMDVEKCLSEWFTLDTMLFLFGEMKVKEMVADKGECVKEYLNNFASRIFYTANTYDQYQALCRKLNMLELEDRRLDAQTTVRATKPLPDYSILKEESERMELKVKAFLVGDTDIPEPEKNVTEESDNEENKTLLPLVDKNAQNALRRRIVCQHLDNVLPDILKSLGLLSLSISLDIRLLVNTFKLKANNIMFKPIQWTLIAIILIKLLSLRDTRLEYLLREPTAFQHMQLLLLSYRQDGGYLERLLSWLTDIDRLLDVDDRQLISS